MCTPEYPKHAMHYEWAKTVRFHLRWLQLRKENRSPAVIERVVSVAVEGTSRLPRMCVRRGIFFSIGCSRQFRMIIG
ncbi:hypothetical protein TNCV_3180471, partial [Trichonephila clavipes]